MMRVNLSCLPHLFLIHNFEFLDSYVKRTQTYSGFQIAGTSKASFRWLNQKSGQGYNGKLARSPDRPNQPNTFQLRRLLNEGEGARICENVLPAMRQLHQLFWLEENPLDGKVCSVDPEAAPSADEDVVTVQGRVGIPCL
jgi:hypothetical protein